MEISVINGMKQCSVCGETKPITDFWLSGKKTKHHSSCKECCKRYQKAHRDKSREYSRKYRENNIEAARARERKNKRDPVRIPEHERARRILRNAIMAGRITKPDYCVVCGCKRSARQLHGHHTDYSKPLDVLWVCSTCHGKFHRIQDEARALLRSEPRGTCNTCADRGPQRNCDICHDGSHYKVEPREGGRG